MIVAIEMMDRAICMCDNVRTAYLDHYNLTNKLLRNFGICSSLLILYVKRKRIHNTDAYMLSLGNSNVDKLKR